MNRARESQPARIVKRAEVSVEPSRVVHAHDAANNAAAENTASMARARHVAKEARLVPNAPGAPGSTAIEVRCSCGEWTRVELAITEDQR